LTFFFEFFVRLGYFSAFLISLGVKNLTVNVFDGPKSKINKDHFEMKKTKKSTLDDNHNFSLTY